MATILRNAQRNLPTTGRPQLCSPLVRRERAQDCCFTPSSPLRLPDPAIYSQQQIIARGTLAAPVTWKNPDIVCHEWQPTRLMPEARITVHNRSAVASAAGVRVDISAFRFGMGFPRQSIGGRQLSIDTGGQATFPVPFPQSIRNADPRIGIEVRIEHPTDLDTGNNVGLYAYEVFHTSVVGRQFQVRFPVRNASASARTIGIRWSSDWLPMTVDSPDGWGVYGGLEERTIAVYVDTQNFTPGPAVKLDAHFMALDIDAGDALIDGLSFEVNVDA